MIEFEIFLEKLCLNKSKKKQVPCPWMTTECYKKLFLSQSLWLKFGKMRYHVDVYATLKGRNKVAWDWE